MGESSRAQEKYIYHTAGTQNLDSTYALQYSPKIPSSRGRIGDRIRPRLDGSEDWIASWSATIQRGLPSKRFSSPLWFFKWQKKKQSNTRRQRTEGGRAHHGDWRGSGCRGRTRRAAWGEGETGRGWGRVCATVRVGLRSETVTLRLRATCEVPGTGAAPSGFVDPGRRKEPSRDFPWATPPAACNLRGDPVSRVLYSDGAQTRRPGRWSRDMRDRNRKSLVFLKGKSACFDGHTCIFLFYSWASTFLYFPCESPCNIINVDKVCIHWPYLPRFVDNKALFTW